MSVLRVTADAADHGVGAELTFRARTMPVEEPHFLVRHRGRTVMDYTRFTQWGAWEGTIEVDRETVAVDAASTWGSRDRSWGLRPVGERVGGAPGPAPQFYWLWAPVSFGDLCTHFDVNEDGLGRRWHESGFLVPVGDAEAEACHADYRVEWRPGLRRAAWFELDLTPFGEATETVRLEPVLDFQMKGLGYFHPQWSHGTWRGELAVGSDRWKLPVDEPGALDNLHIQSVCRATMGGRQGMGVLEQLVIGPTPR
jgi:hypothetical protein